LEKSGHRVIPFSTNLRQNFPSGYSKYFVDGYTEDSFGSLSAYKKIRIFFNDIYSLEAKRKLRQIISDEKPDLAHLHGVFYQLSLSVFDVLKEQGIPTVMSLNDYLMLCADGYLYRDGHICELCKNRQHRNIILHKCYKDSFCASLMAYLVKKSQYRKNISDVVNRFIVPQEDMKNIFAEWGFDRDKLSVLHNPFDASIYTPNYTHKDYIVLYCRLARLKGVFTVLKAMTKLRNIKLKIFGGGPDQHLVERFIRDNKLDNVEANYILRWGNDLIDEVSNAKFVIAAPEWYTPNDYITYESFALGKPVIASKIGGNNFLIKDRFNGLFFTPQDPDSLAEKIRYLFNKDDLIAQMGKNARHFVEAELNYGRFYKGLLEIYNSVLKK
jgi:glycosyltransferase involved in cell wall biosynthesis